MECEFLNPVNYAGATPVEGEFWQFKNATCSEPAYISLVEDGTDAHFYLDERISYGDIFILTFILLIFLAGIFKIVWNFFVPIMTKTFTRNDL